VWLEQQVLGLGILSTRKALEPLQGVLRPPTLKIAHQPLVTGIG
jgi:hypothetical protein